MMDVDELVCPAATFSGRNFSLSRAAAVLVWSIYGNGADLDTRFSGLPALI